MLSGWSGALRPRKVTKGFGSAVKPTQQNRGYVGPVRQGIKKKPIKRKLTDMPEYKKRVQENKERIEAEMGPTNFVRLFGPNSTLPALPQEPKPTGKYAALFPGEEDVPKETEMMIGELDRDFERLRYKAAIVLQDPDYIIFDSLTQYRIRELELQWLADPAAPSRENKAKLEKEIEEVVFETQVEFQEYFAQKPYLTKMEVRKVRQVFLNEMEGRVHFFPQDKWKLQLIDPKYDLEKNPLSMKERIKLFSTPTAKLAAKPALLYKQYRELALHVEGSDKAVALPTERVLAHFEMRKHKEKLAEMEKKDLEDELEQMEFETDMLLHANEDAAEDEGYYRQVTDDDYQRKM